MIEKNPNIIADLYDSYVDTIDKAAGVDIAKMKTAAAKKIKEILEEKSGTALSLTRIRAVINKFD